jgi:hypothetical protein
MSQVLRRRIAELDSHIEQLSRDLAGMPTPSRKGYLILFQAVQLGAATMNIEGLSGDAILRFRHEVAERLAGVLGDHGIS